MFEHETDKNVVEVCIFKRQSKYVALLKDHIGDPL